MRLVQERKSRLPKAASAYWSIATWIASMCALHQPSRVERAAASGRVTSGSLGCPACRRSTSQRRRAKEQCYSGPLLPFCVRFWTQEVRRQIDEDGRPHGRRRGHALGFVASLVSLVARGSVDRRPQAANADFHRFVINSTIALLALGAIALIGIVGMTVWLAERANVASEQALQIRNVRTAAVELRSAVQAAESSQRGFLVGGNEIYLAPYGSAKSQARVSWNACVRIGRRPISLRQ